MRTILKTVAISALAIFGLLLGDKAAQAQVVVGATVPGVSVGVGFGGYYPPPPAVVYPGPYYASPAVVGPPAVAVGVGLPLVRPYPYYGYPYRGGYYHGGYYHWRR
jgi:hypothetical protein